MSYTITSIDTATLPTALLPLAKQHMRVDFADDDTVIAEYLAQSIGLLEAFWGLSIFAGTVAWTPEPAGSSRYATPFQPVASFTVNDGATDVSADYAIERKTLPEPVYLVRKDGTAFHGGAAVTLVTGYASQAAMPPQMRAAILTVAGTRYEHRESVVALSLDELPQWASAVLGGLWIPRA